MSDNVTKSELITGMLKSADIASNILNALNFQRDLDEMTKEYNAVQKRLPRALQIAQDLVNLGKRSGLDILKTAVGDLPQVSKFLVDNLRNQILGGAAGLPMTASMYGQEGKLIAIEGFADLYATLLYEMPKGFISEKAHRYYNKVFQSFIFNPEFVTKLWNKSKVNETYWRDRMLEHGIPKIEQDLILDEIEEKPAINTALRMYQYIDMTDKDIDYILNENNVSDPMIKTLWKKYFHANRLRDEMLAYKQYLYKAYQNGLLTDLQLEVELDTFKASQEEIDVIVETQALEFQRTLTMTEVETRTWLYRKGVYATEIETTGTVTHNATPSPSYFYDTARTEADHYFKDMFMWLANGEFRTIADWDLATHKFTFTDPFDEAVEDDVTYSVYTKTAEETLYEGLILLGLNSAIVNAQVRLEASKFGRDWERA